MYNSGSETYYKEEEKKEDLQTEGKDSKRL